MLLETLKVFRDLVETSSFSRAAELNYITQSAVSQQLKNLERTLGCTLVHRIHRDLRLTPAGLIFHNRSRKIVSDYEEMLQQLKAVSPGGLGSLRIATVYSVGVYGLPAYVGRFMKRHPDVKIDIDYRKAEQIYRDVLAGRADLGVVVYAAKRRGIEAIPLYREEMKLVCHPRHALCAQNRVSISHLEGQNFIAFYDAAPTRLVLDRLFKKHGVKICTKMELENIETIKGAVQAGTGVSVLPDAAVRNEVKMGKLCALRFSDARIFRPVCVLVRKRRKFNKAVRLFLEHIQKGRIRTA